MKKRSDRTTLCSMSLAETAGCFGCIGFLREAGFANIYSVRKNGMIVITGEKAPAELSRKN